MGEQLAQRGCETIVGLDILPEAREAAERDRSDVYQEYHVVDLTDLSPNEQGQLEAHDFDCLVTVAALGYGDIPPRAFAEAYNLVTEDGWVALNVKERLLSRHDETGFS